MQCPICGAHIVNNENKCRNCGYGIPYNYMNNQQMNNQQMNNQQMNNQQMNNQQMNNQQMNNQQMNNQQMNNQQMNNHDNYGYKEGVKNTQGYYENNQYGYTQPQYNNYNKPKESSGVGIIIATIILIMLLCCGGIFSLGIVGFSIISNVENEHTEITDIIEDTESDYDPDFGYGGKREEWENKKATVLNDDTLNLEIYLCENSVITEKGDVTFKLDFYNAGDEMVDISIKDVKINELDTYDYDSEYIRLGSNTVVDGYDQTKYGEEFKLINNIGNIESFKFTLDIYYPNVDKRFDTTEFYVTKSGFSYIAKVNNPEEIISNKNQNNNSSVDKNVGINYYGNDTVGYVILDGMWYNFIDDSGSSLTPNTVQYSNGSRILTMDVYNDVRAIDIGNSLYYTMTYNQNVKSISLIDQGQTYDNEYYQVLIEYNDGTLWEVIYFTDYRTDNTLYFSYETFMCSADKEEFLSEAYNIFSTYTTEGTKTI